MSVCLLALALGACARIGEPEIPSEPVAHDMRVIGSHPLAGRSAYQPVLRSYGDQRILFVGHHAGNANSSISDDREPNGVSILDVTNPAAPVLLRHLPPTGAGISGAQHVQVCRGDELPKADPSRVYLLRTNGQVSHELWDVSDPANPLFIVTIAPTEQAGGTGRNTHKNWWDCRSGVGYLVSSAPGWRAARVLRAFDLGNPAEPVLIRDFALDGMQVGGDMDLSGRPGVHQATVRGDRIYLAYGPASHGLVQILDKEKFLRGDPDVEEPFSASRRNLLYPEVGRWTMPRGEGAHTAKPLFGDEAFGGAEGAPERRFMVVSSEEIVARCGGPRHAVHFVEITREAQPAEAARFEVPAEPGGFCEQGGRFGPHGINEARIPWLDDKILLAAYFNAGIRAVDIRDPTHPVEIAHLIPGVTGATEPSCGGESFGEDCAVVIQTNNVAADERGYIYLLDRAGTGLHIAELTGAARKLAGLAGK